MRQKEMNPQLFSKSIATLEDILEGSYENGNLSLQEYEDCLQLIEYVYKKLGNRPRRCSPKK